MTRTIHFSPFQPIRSCNRISLFTSLQSQIEKLAATSTKTTAPGDLAAEVKRLIDLGVLIQDASGAILTVHSPEQLSSGE